MTGRPQKRRRSDVFKYEIEDPSEAESVFQTAEAVLNLVRARHISEPDHEDVETARTRRDEAKAALDACFGRIDLLAPLRPDLDALVQEDSERRAEIEAERKAAKAEGREYPEDDEDDEKQYAPDSFFIRLLEMSAVPLEGKERTTAKEWSEMLSGGEWLAEDRVVLADKVYKLSRHRHYDVGKGLGTTLN